MDIVDWNSPLSVNRIEICLLGYIRVYGSGHVELRQNKNIMHIRN